MASVARGAARRRDILSSASFCSILPAQILYSTNIRPFQTAMLAVASSLNLATTQGVLKQFIPLGLLPGIDVERDDASRGISLWFPFVLMAGRTA